jgi:FkbM family methyltransferase
MNLARKTFNCAREHLRKFRVRKHLADSDWSEVCYNCSIPLNNVELGADNSLLLKFDDQQIILTKDEASVRILLGYFRLNDLVTFTNCQISWNKSKNALALCWDDATYLVENSEEIDILFEIYMSGDYDYSTSKPTVIVDIGANVGFASIFLAETNRDIIIEACEPLKANYEKALRNFSENTYLSQRINLYNFGLFSEDGEQILFTEPEGRGRSSIVIDRTIAPIGKVETVSIVVRRASSFIREVRERYPQRQIVIKMDCEGSEYVILKNLQEDGALSLIDGFMMEWHKILGDQTDANYIRNFLSAAGFNVCVQGRYQSKSSIGMAYAFRCSSDQGGIEA